MAKTTYSREELERQLSESRREFWAADATINNLELKIAEMAARLANAEKRIAELESLTAPQLSPLSPVVPDEMPAHIGPREFGRPQAYIDGWNACRADMLQDSNHTEQNLDMVDHSGDANEKVNSPAFPDCWCCTCRPVKMNDMRFVVCPECGNKRCPHANDHRNACSGSNEPGQECSAYPAAPQQEVKK